jgi:glutamyl-tRNA synthetase
VRPIADLNDLARLIDFSHISRAPAKFDESELEHLNARLIHEMPYEAARERLAQRDADAGEAFWIAVRGNLTKVQDAAEWAKVVRGPVTPVIADRAFIDAATGVLPAERWDASTWKAWTEAVKAATGVKGKALFMPLRLALTGLDHGPELGALLPLIGPERAKARLSGQVA